tara:strand:+ start:1881 stop:4340 length:2460 start_codon:yes stop_codon:yes gene_type:complete
MFDTLTRLGASNAGDYEIEKSLRFNNDDTPKLSKSWSGDDGNLKTQTYSFWFKRKKSGSSGYFITAFNGSNTDRIGITSDSQFFVEFKDGGSTEAEWHSDRVLQDESAWYHAVVAIDTTQSTETDRFKVWINGVATTNWDTYNAVDQDYQLDGFGRANKTHVIGAYASGSTSTSSHFDGYIAEFHYLDGVVATASDFGKTNPVTGQWIPIKYTGSYGSKGWYLNFSDNSDVTDATLGADSSGNGNNWTPANLSVSSGIGNDSFTDTPTNNFMNMMSDGRLNTTVSEGGMKMVTTGSNVTSYSSFQIPTSGKWYFEVKMTTTAETMVAFDSAPRINYVQGPPGGDGDFAVYIYAGSYEIYYGGSSVTSGTMGHGAGTVYQFWFDRDNHTLKIVRDDDAESFTWSIPTALQAYPLAVGRCHTTTWTAGTWEWYFGGNGFNYDIPDGYNTLSTKNLPDPIIAKGTDHFGSFNYNGDPSTTTRDVTGLDFNPDLIILQRAQTAGGGHTHVYDTNRGMGSNKEFLLNHDAYKEGDENGATYGYVDEHTGDGSAGSGGVKIVKGSDTNYGNNSFNYTGGVFNVMGWLGAGSTETSNTAGDITSSVSANQTAGFSIVTYTGTGTAGDTVGHGLGVKPEWIITKNRDYAASLTGVGDATSNGWGYETYPGENYIGSTNNNAHNGTAPTSTVYSLGSGDTTNRNGDKIVAYCFASVPGYSKFSWYQGNGDTDGPFLYLGFRPQLLVTKQFGTASHWYVWEDTSNPYNSTQFVRWWNLTGAMEDHPAYRMDFHANGVKIRNSESDTNQTNYHCVYMAFAKSPFKYSNAN